VFAGGDCVRGGSEVVFAVREGKRAAHGINAAIMGVR
jgi:NADPH-dependent glutamate synthase beta subunit-like oxidoreductase